MVFFMAEETQEVNVTPKSKVIAKNYVYMMGEKGGLGIEVREKLEERNRYLRFNKWWGNVNTNLILNKEKHWIDLKSR